MPPLGVEGMTERLLCGRFYMCTALGGRVGSGNLGLWLLGRAVLMFSLGWGVLFRHGCRRLAHFFFKALGHGFVHLTKLLSELQHFSRRGSHRRYVGVGRILQGAQLLPFDKHLVFDGFHLLGEFGHNGIIFLQLFGSVSASAHHAVHAVTLHAGAGHLALAAAHFPHAFRHIARRGRLTVN